jgi:hypothetical protein
MSLLVLTSSGRVRVIDEVMPVYQTESLVERGATAIPQAVSANFFFGKMDRAGNPQAPYPPGPAVLAVPWYLGGKHVLVNLPGVPARARTLVTDFAIVSSSATFAAAAAALTYLLFIRFGFAARNALLATLGLVFGTPLFAYSAWFFSEPLALALLMVAVLAVFPGEEEGIPIRRGIVAGLALGFLLWVRPAHLMTVAVVMAAMLAGRGPLGRKLPGIAVAATLVGCAGLALLARNYVLHGSAFDLGYPEFVEGGRRMTAFDTPFLVGLYAFLLSPGKSILLFAPVILVAPFALPQVWRRSRALAVLMVAPLMVLVLFYARYAQFDGGYSFGPRYMIPGIFLLGLTLGFVLESGSARLRTVALGLVLAGTLVNAIGMATSPLEDMAGGRYYDEQYKYRLDYNPLEGQLGLLLKYATDEKPAPIGRGFDRWFVFLRKGGVSTGWLALVGGVTTTFCFGCGWQLRRALAQS